MHEDTCFLGLDNPIKDYAWGHDAHINDLLGLPATPGQPQAELWMGAHPGAPSLVRLANGARVSLAELIQSDPVRYLGGFLHEQGIGALPFLFKVLAAGKPLSIQAHPSLAAARAGFAAENAAGIPVGDSRRNYKDSNHKPEIICALSEFWGLCGFRPQAEIRADLARVGSSCADAKIAAWFLALAAHGQREGLAEANYCRHLTQAILSLGDLCPAVVAAALECARGQQAAHWAFMREAAVHFPDDAGLLFFLGLQLHQLQPGQALSIPAGVLHAYLRGFGIELMANSDNVLRGGLTPKHIDVVELMNNLDFSAHGVRSEPVPGEVLNAYPAFSPEFCLSRASSHPGTGGRQELGTVVTPRIALCTQGEVVLEGGDGSRITLSRGQSVYILPRGQTLDASIVGELFIAAVPQPAIAAGLVMGVDGGGTSTRVCLMDTTGKIRASGKGGPSSIDTVALAQTGAAISLALDQALAQAGPEVAAMPIIRVVAGIGGVVSAEDERVVAELLARLPGVRAGSPCMAVNDMKTALAAGTGLQPGITCILGTGSVAYGRNAAGEEHKSGGWGWKEGDPGSSFDLGISAIRAMVRAYDGRRPESGFARAVFDRLGLSRLADITRRLYAQDMGRTEIAALAPIVCDWANRGDATARAIIDRAVGDVTETVVAVFTSLFQTGQDTVPVAMVGSLGNADGYYHDSLARAFSRASPRLVMQAALLEPVIGAALWALRDLGVPLNPQCLAQN